MSVSVIVNVKMNFIFLCAALPAILPQFTLAGGMAVGPRMRFQGGIPHQMRHFFEDNDEICSSHRNYRQAPTDEATAGVQQAPTDAEAEMKIVIKQHNTQAGAEEAGDQSNPASVKPPTSAEENERLLKVLQKKMDSIESNDKHPKTRSFPQPILHHKDNRFDSPSNGNLEVFLGGSSNAEESYEPDVDSEPEWMYQGLGHRREHVHQQRYRQGPPQYRNNRPQNSPGYRVKDVVNQRYTTRGELPESQYDVKEESGRGKYANKERSGEYIQSGYRKDGTKEESHEYVPKINSGYREHDNDDAVSGVYLPKTQSGKRRYDNDEEKGEESKKESGYKSYEKQDKCSEYGPRKYSENYGKDDDDSNPGEDVLLKISVNNDKDSPDVGKVKIDVNKDKDLYPEERQVKVSVKKDKDLLPVDQREIKIEIGSDSEQEEDGGDKVRISVQKQEDQAGNERTVLKVKKPERKCSKPRKNKCRRKRKD